jgi:hypothetical protein
MRIGKNQLQLLATLASPTVLMLAPSKEARGLVKRGLLREREPGKSCCITPAGLRALACEIEAGRVDDALEAMRKQVAEREKRRRAP